MLFNVLNRRIVSTQCNYLNLLKIMFLSFFVCLFFSEIIVGPFPEELQYWADP